MAPHRFETATGKRPLTRRTFLQATSGVLGLTAVTTAGAARTTEIDAANTVQTTHSTKLIAEDGAAFDAFGSAVALQGTTALVGAHQRGDTDAGAAYVFDRDGTGWRQTATLRPENTRVRAAFGEAVALDGERALVGAPFDPAGGGGGSAYVFQ